MLQPLGVSRKNAEQHADWEQFFEEHKRQIGLMVLCAVLLAGVGICMHAHELEKMNGRLLCGRSGSWSIFVEGKRPRQLSADEVGAGSDSKACAVHVRSICWMRARHQFVWQISCYGRRRGLPVGKYQLHSKL